MTAQELKQAFLIQYDVISGMGAPGYTDEEISLFLTDSELDLVRKLIPIYDVQELQKKIMSKLITPKTILTLDAISTDNHPNGRYVTLPTDMLAVFEEYVKFSGSSTLVKVDPVTHDRYIIDINNPYKQPYAGLVWRMDVAGKHELITDGQHTIASYSFIYVRQPVGIDITAGKTSEINIGFQDMVVDGAVKIALETITRYKNLSRPQQQPQQQQQTQE